MPAWSPGRPRLPEAVRKRVLRRCPWCQTCGLARSTEVDHVIPLAEGGPNTEANAQALCSPCHLVKTKAERRRGQQRYQERRPRMSRQPESHPGLTG